MYKKNPYQENIKLEISERDKRIVAKAKKYNINSFENPHFTQNIFNSKPENIAMKEDIVDFFTWILKEEKSLQMSKEKE